MKTCGTTTPLECIENLTKIVKEFAGYDRVEVEIASDESKDLLAFPSRRFSILTKTSKDQNSKSILTVTLSKKFRF